MEPERKRLTGGITKPSTVRSFVCVAIAKIIRRLTVGTFILQLRKLINAIVVKGLREKDLLAREKARKALVRVVAEVSPKFLALIAQEMHNNLTRGYQVHVFLYTVHHLTTQL